MKLSTQARYAIRSMLAISRLSENQRPVSLGEVAKRAHLSRKYLEQLVIKLKRASLVQGVRGRCGGYVLSRRPDEIRVGQIVEATIGPISIVDCVLDPGTCVLSESCECRGPYCLLNDKIREVLHGFTLADLATQGPQGPLAAHEGPSAANVA